MGRRKVITIKIAANNSSEKDKLRADHFAWGEHDQDIIEMALGEMSEMS